jgi:hypothetical protein
MSPIVPVLKFMYKAASSIAEKTTQTNSYCFIDGLNQQRSFIVILCAYKLKNKGYDKISPPTHVPSLPILQTQKHGGVL